MTIAAVLLAAGAGSRFVGPSHKLMALMRGRPVVLWALEAAVDAGFDEVVLVTGAIDVAVELAADPGGLVDPHQLDQVTVLANPRWAEGMATSLAVAVEHARDRGHQAIVVGLADQPFVTAAAWQAVAASRSPIAVATYGGKRRNPVRLGASVWPLLPATGDEGARAVLAARAELVEPIPCEGLADDIDTVEDLRRWS
ncbi:MAG: molybdenum cofactor cytidylyltransferase [Candidatus Poriferisodalaceae bacterium]